MKIIVTIIATDLVTNLHLSFCLSFRTNQKQESGVQQAGGLVTRNISVFFLFIASRILLQIPAELNRLL